MVGEEEESEWKRRSLSLSLCVCVCVCVCVSVSHYHPLILYLSVSLWSPLLFLFQGIGSVEASMHIRVKRRHVTIFVDVQPDETVRNNQVSTADA